MLLALLCFLLGPAVVGFLCWLTTRFRYQISEVAVEVTLFGVVVRRVRLLDIRAISKRRPFWSEHWWNTHRPYGRFLVLHRHTGFFKHFIITPRKRYVFKAHLERALRQLHAARYVPSEEFDEGEAGEDAEAGGVGAVAAGEHKAKQAASSEKDLPRPAATH
jgi:hypothetical protein